MVKKQVGRKALFLSKQPPTCRRATGRLTLIVAEEGENPASTSFPVSYYFTGVYYILYTIYSYENRKSGGVVILKLRVEHTHSRIRNPTWTSFPVSYYLIHVRYCLVVVQIQPTQETRSAGYGQHRLFIIL